MTSTVSSLLILDVHQVNPTGKEIGHGAYGRAFEFDYEGTLCAAKEVATHSITTVYTRQWPSKDQRQLS